MTSIEPPKYFSGGGGILSFRFFGEEDLFYTKKQIYKKKLHTYFTKSIYTYNGDAIHNIHAGSLRTTSYRSL